MQSAAVPIRAQQTLLRETARQVPPPFLAGSAAALDTPTVGAIRQRVLRRRVLSERKGGRTHPEHATPIQVGDPECQGKEHVVGSFTRKHIVYWRRQCDRFYFVPIAAILDQIHGDGWYAHAVEGIRRLDRIEMAAAALGLTTDQYLDQVLGSDRAPAFPALAAAAG